MTQTPDEQLLDYARAVARGNPFLLLALKLEMTDADYFELGARYRREFVVSAKRRRTDVRS